MNHKIIVQSILVGLTCFVGLTTTCAQGTFDRLASVNVANELSSTYTVEQDAIGRLDFNDPSRLLWSNLPLGDVTRKGIQIKDFSDQQRVFLHQLLQNVLSPQGYQKILSIIQYDEGTHQKLSTLNSPIAHRYGHLNYWFTIYGTPSVDSLWSWKFEGHHISINITYTQDEVICTPMFVGINPALTRNGPYAGFHILEQENNIGNNLFNSLDLDLRQKAIVGVHPPDADVLTKLGNEPHTITSSGVAYDELSTAQQSMVQDIIKAWVGNIHHTLADKKMADILKNRNDIVFYWYGGPDTNDLHYYAIKSKDFIIEFTHRDGGLDHYHTLWYEFQK